MYSRLAFLGEMSRSPSWNGYVSSHSIGVWCHESTLVLSGIFHLPHKVSDVITVDGCTVRWGYRLLLSPRDIVRGISPRKEPCNHLQMFMWDRACFNGRKGVIVCITTYMTSILFRIPVQVVASSYAVEISVLYSTLISTTIVLHYYLSS